MTGANEFVLVDGASLRVVATTVGVQFSFAKTGIDAGDPASWPPPDALAPAERAVATDLQLLLEQELAVESDSAAILPVADWPLAVELGIRSLTAFSAPSHLLLAVDRSDDLGRPDFRYVVRWLQGEHEVAVTRAGSYVRQESSGRVMHLDGRTVALVEAMDAFNALAPKDRGKTAAWTAFASIRDDAAATGALLDRYLADNSVIIPNTIGLAVRDHGDGSITFEPRVAGLPDADAFTTKFLERTSTDAVETLTDAKNRRVRVLFSEPQLEVLRRMRSVRKLRGDDAKRLSKDPAAAFDGVADAVDLLNIERQYGPRVIGVGALKLSSDSHNDSGRRITDLLGYGTESAPPPESNPDQRTGSSPDLKPARAAVSIDVVDAVDGTLRTLRLQGDEGVSELHAEVVKAISSGVERIEFGGVKVLVESALEAVLRAHRVDRTVAAVSQEDVGRVGRSGHLYLLIDEHEDTLTTALLVPDDEPATVEIAVDYLPASLLPSTTLQDYQRDGIQWLASTRAAQGRRGGVLADDMGLGKTLQLLTHVAHLIESRALDDAVGQGPNGPWRPVLIVAPLLLVESGTWTEEMRRHFKDAGQGFEPLVVLRDEGIDKVRHVGAGRDLLGKPVLDPARLMRHKVVITTYETLVAYQHSLAQLIDGRPLWSLVIFDEAQQVKSPATKKSHAAKALDARFKIAATGTPVETRLRDLWNLLDTVEPTRLGTQRHFVAEYERPAQNAPDASSRRAALDRLRTVLHYQEPGAFLLRRDKSILTSLPPKIEHRPRCEMTGEERKANAGIIAIMRGPGGKRAALSTLQKLHLASQHPVLLERNPQFDNIESLISASSRLRATVEVLREVKAAGEKAIIFARSVDGQRLLAHVLGHVFGRRIDVLNGETGLGAGRLGGGTGSVRRNMLARFRGTVGFDVIVLSPFVAGVGLTLVEANHVIHYGRWWNPAVEGQATDRTFRIGQTRPVHVYFPILTDPTGEIAQTFDEALDVLISSRRGLATDFLSPVPEEEDAAQLFATIRGTKQVSDLQESSPVAQTPTSDTVAGLMLAAAEREGERAVWLGADGRLGAHALRTHGDLLKVIRIVERSTEFEASSARDAAAAWERVLSGRKAVPVLVSRDRGSLPDIEQLSWDQVGDQASSSGLTVDDGLGWLVAATDVTVIREALRL